MYEFTNGIVVFDEKTKDRYIEAGYRLVTSIKNNKNCVIKINDKVIEDENTSNNGIIEGQSKKRNKLSK